jgi:6-phosphogluconate dehydrogenase
MRLGMIGLGRMGADMVRRLQRGGLQSVVFDIHEEKRRALEKDGALAAASVAELVEKLPKPRAVWLMLPAAIIDRVLDDVVPLLSAGDTVIDGGNSHYPNDLRRAAALKSKGLHYLDVGTSGGVWGLERGYCLMIGGDAEPVAALDDVFRALAPAGGYLHCGASGAGHFVKMIHNGIEYGMMASIAEGLNVLHRANAGATSRAADAETAPLNQPEHYQYNFDVAAITEVWRHGSVISSWLMDLTAAALAADPALEKFAGRVSDSGEGRWTIAAAIDEGVPVPVLSAALFERFSSQGSAEFAGKVLSAMRAQFGGHGEKPRG